MNKLKAPVLHRRAGSVFVFGLGAIQIIRDTLRGGGTGQCHQMSHGGGCLK